MRRILEDEPIGDAPAIHNNGNEDDDEENEGSEILGYQQNSLRATSADDELDFEACFDIPTINSIVVTVADTTPALPPSETVLLDDASDPILLRRLAETYDSARHLSFAHADNGSMACTANDRHLLFAYRPLHRTNVRLFDAGHHAHHPVGVGFLCVPVDNRGNAGGPTSVFIRTYYTPTIPGIIISHAAISKQLGTDGYHMSSFTEGVGHIHFPNKIRRSQDIYIILQPTANRGGLTFTEALIAPTPEAHLAPLPSNQVIRKLCTEHAPVTAATILDPVDGMTCEACHSPPADTSARRYIYGNGMAAVNQFDTPTPTSVITTDDSPNLIVQRPELLDAMDPFPEFSSASNEAYTIRSLSRSALRMLWHQRLGHINFRRLSEMHRFVKGMPQFTVPTEIEGCPICLASKLRKALREQGRRCGQRHATKACQLTLVSWCRKAATQFDITLVGLNGETCYVLLTDHYSGRIFGRAFATKAPPVDWINSWLASNAPQCPDKYVRMDGGGELGKCRDIHRTFANFGYVVELTGPDSSHQNGPGERPHQTIGDALRTMLSGANLQPNFWPPYEMCGAPLPNLAKLRTFGCRIHVRPTTARYGRVVPNSRLGIFLGYSRSLKVMYYFDLGSSTVKTATHARFDEGMNDLDEPPPNVKLLRNLADGGVVDPDRLDLPPFDLDVSDDPFDRLDELSPPITCEHPSLGFEIKECHIRKRGFVSGIIPNTTASRIRNRPSWEALQAAATSEEQSFKIVFAPDRYIPVVDRHLDQPLHLSVDQLRTVSTILSMSSSPRPEPFDNSLVFPGESGELDDDHVQLLLRSLNTTTHGTPAEQSLGSFTRRKLRRLPNWKEWQDAEFKQLDSMAKQEMYGAPVVAPKDAIVLRQHWNYAIKGDGTRKARNCCDGSPRSPQLKLANTYSSCIEQPCMRLFFALCAHEGYISLKVDATNAYANSPPPNQPTFVIIDDQYADWHLARHGTSVPRNMVLPVQHALQGHPESGALWEKFVNAVIARHGFTSTTHERSLYQGIYNGHRMLICRQVDDLAIGCVDVNAVKDLVRVICSEDGIDLRDEGILESFNGVDIAQRDRYIKITCESYIDKLLAHYGWSSSGSRETDEKPIEPLAASTTQQMFDDYITAPRDGTPEYCDIETAAGFSYRSVLGALIYAYVVARPDIGYAVTTLARFSDHPAKVHYDALRRVARYLRMTKIGVCSIGETSFWQHFRMATSRFSLLILLSLTSRNRIPRLNLLDCQVPSIDSFGARISSTRSDHAFEDNAAAILMVNASRPTPRARHIDIQHFALQEWKAANEIVLSHIPGVVNSADSLTKSLGSTLHHRHVRRLMGHYGAPWSPPAP
ncbi:Reverse transcriptase (RNA-dependent DNA polymerase) [Fragilaria crotonensis]|nr:Reverse transcriptase (RNA-dependent DNA polymerase) [Fragilaria crotonensis]